MTRRLLLVVFVLFLPVQLFAAEDHKNLTKSEKEYVANYVKAINAKDENKLKELMHLSSLGCINDSNKDYFADRFKREFRKNIPEDYNVSITPLSQDDIAKEIEGARQRGLPYSSKPTHQLQIDFDKSKYSSVTIGRKLIQEGDSYFEIFGCPSADALEKFREQKIKKDADNARAEKLFKELKDPLLSELKKLLNDEKEIEALKKYREVTGEDLGTANKVLSHIKDEK